MKNQKENIKVFTQRLDFYGQALAAYSIILVLFLLLHAVTHDGTITFAIHQPIVILMFIFILVTAIMLLVTSFNKRQIMIGESHILFKNRFFSKKINTDEILKIRIRRSPTKVVNSNASLISIKVKNKKKFYLVRTASFNNDKELYASFVNIKRKHNI